MTQSGYFRPETIVVLDMSIAYGKLLIGHGISEGSADKKFSTREYKNRMVYDCFNNTYTYDCSSPTTNIHTVTIDDTPCTNERSHCTPVLLPDEIYVASENSVSNFIVPYDSPQLIFLTSGYLNPHYAMKKYEPYHGRVKRE